MLITNFASGELSENLFGRIDLPQYFQGVSRLENFDVVPTGGIKRRNGLRRLAELGRKGRIIPFIVDRENSYLLYLSPKNGNTPARISVYTQEGVLKSSADSTESFKLFQTMDEINQVQYAQNFDVMILCHENNNPVEVKFENGSLDIRLFNISYKVKTLVSQNLNENNYVEFDNGNNLLREGNFPRCVSFFNGRLVFAGTKTMPQRIFASKVGNIHDFSTYKLSVQEVREYFTVLSTVTDEGKIKIAKPEIAIRFVKPINEYYVHSIYFPPGTRIKEINGDKIAMEDELTLTEPLNKNFYDKVSIEEDFEKLKSAYNDAEKKEPPGNKTGERYVNCKTIVKTSYLFDIYRPVPGNPIYAGTQDIVEIYYLRYGAHNIQIEYFFNASGMGPAYDQLFYEYRDAVGFETDIASFTPEEIENKLKDLLDDAIKLITPIPKSSNLRNWDQKKYWNAAVRDEVVSYMKNAIENGMKYILHSKDGGYNDPYYGRPEDIINAIRPFLTASENIYVSFFTREFIKDRYPSPDDGFTFEIASDMSDAIKWIGQNKNLIVGTETGEWIIPAGVHATNIQAVLNSRYGSDNVQGTAIGDAFCFIQTGKKAVVEYYIPQQDNNFRANNMAMLSKNMLGESAAFDFDFASAPYTRIFISREDGTVVCLLYERMTGTFAWSRITTREGHCLRSAAVLPGDGEDETYFVVERGVKFFLERLDGRGEVYLDSFHTGQPGTGETREGAYSGFPYTSRVRSMPVLANDKMKNQAIKRLTIRFLDSFLPRVKSVVGVNREVQEDTIARKEPYSGVISIPFPGQYDRDVFFEFVHDGPTRCQILAVNAEAN